MKFGAAHGLAGGVDLRDGRFVQFGSLGRFGTAPAAWDRRIWGCGCGESAYAWGGGFTGWAWFFSVDA